MKPPNFDLAAARTVMDVVDHGRSLDDALTARRTTPLCHRRALLQEICYGACRYYHYFDGILAQLLNKPIRRDDRVVHFILINACYQLDYMRTPDHAAVSRSVEAVAGTRFSWAGKMINGVLRNFLRQRERLKQDLSPDPARFSFPPWLYREISTHWPDHFRQVLESSNRKPPLTMRVNVRKISRDDYLERLSQAGIAASPTADSELGVSVAEPMPVERIPGFADGLVSVQDESAQLVLAASALRPGERVLDGCAAPGGKTCLLLESHPKLAAMVAVDLPQRVDLLRQNLARLDLDTEAAVKVVAADLTRAEGWWDGRLFDHILLDVPCSGSGIIRRHPDIKHCRKPEDIAKFARQQLTLLSKAWLLLGNGGTLLYVTCSILPAENDEVIEKFLKQRQGAEAELLDALPDALPGVATRFGRQRLPGVHPGDGFYYCRLKKSLQKSPQKSPE